MRPSAPDHEPIIHVVAALAMLAAPAATGGCKQDRSPEPAPAAPAVPARGSGAAGIAPEMPRDDARPATNTITISVADKRAPDKALARRCTLGGDPLVGACVGGGEGIAVGKDGVVYVVAGSEVRRFSRADGAGAAASTAGDVGCRLEPSGAPIALPPEPPRPQKLGGPVYMRSGGAAWSVVAAGGAVYAHDFLGGLVRIDRGTPEPACVDVFGYRHVAPVGGKLLVVRKGIEQVVPGKTCKVRSAGIDDQARGEAYAVGDRLYVASGGALVRYTGAAPEKVAEGARICSITGVTGCGDGACVLDQNCMQVIQLDGSGKVVRVIDDDVLFAARPWSIGEAVTLPDGTVLVYARHRDQTGGKEICEAAIYELPAALFAR